MDTEKGSDSLYILNDSYAQNENYKYSGIESAEFIRVFNKKLIIQFTSDKTNQSRGFSLTFQAKIGNWEMFIKRSFQPPFERNSTKS